MKRDKINGAIFFADLRNAFYSVIRGFALPIDDDVSYEKLIDDIPVALIPAVQEIIHSAPFAAQCCDDQHVLQQLSGAQRA
eukprot:11765136-Karenia_brevis.AAC.1